MAYPQETFRFAHVDATSLLGQRRAAASASMITYQLQILKDTGRYDAFSLKWQPIYDKVPEYWPIADHLFWDSDIGKWIEGACYFLQGESNPNPVVDGAIKELVEMIRRAQQPDGYLNIHYQVVEPGKRFTNLRDMHELYNLGHLIEGALAHNQYYGNDLFLEPMLKYVSLIHRVIGPRDGQLHGYPGHPELEIALMRLHHRTGDEKSFELARYFINERGNPTGVDGREFYTVEAEKRNEALDWQPVWYPAPRSHWYQQAHAPIAKQDTIEGHSVRAMYLLTAVADLVRVNPDSTDLKEAVYKLWNNMVEKRMYMTGGIGSMKQWEGFGPDYFLPQGTDEGGCYAETCAAIGVMMLAQRMLQYDLSNEYGDVMELCLYNAVFTAMSVDCMKFTYVNQLASSEKNPSERFGWFQCACCPPNVLRLLGMIGGYVWNVSESKKSDPTQIDVHLYAPATLNFETSAGQASLKQECDWPRDGSIKFSLIGEKRYVQLKLRIPGWATAWEISPALSHLDITDGYLTIPAEYLALHPDFNLTFDLKPRLIAPHPLTNQQILTVARGPIVYCVEDVDNTWVTDHFRSTHLDPECLTKNAVTEIKTADPSLPDEIYVSITVHKAAYTVDFDRLKIKPSVDKEDLHKTIGAAKVIDELKFVPYYYRANRGGHGMARVGLKQWTW
ncbi:glycoside hydrolase family 127 protein [Didymella exigua CBS 183.55]|uniref:Glycoside hydrolase family 127 protein n=1 Tax=Didymella exigua CBS 183.55 TaxID=1150837 RepID=A0A6A5RZS2_9PLEO|nr:glycoside hydrolase family 127 protein [Didymella exigua CBS 183.55]KAF1933965.1 glycoside hydrolase family 127 protein [Didymella exigua CBS 183.55]